MFNIFLKQGTSKRSASTSMIGDREPGDMATPTTGEQAGAGDMAWAGACEELSDAQLATCCVGGLLDTTGNGLDDLDTTGNSGGLDDWPVGVRRGVMKVGWFRIYWY